MVRTMSELRLVLAIVIIVILVALVQSLPVAYIFYGILGALNVINVVVTYINIWQARKCDPRFLHAGWLGLISLLVGLALFALFRAFFGFGYLSVLGALPFVWGGIATIAATGLFAIARKFGAAIPGPDRSDRDSREPGSAG